MGDASLSALVGRLDYRYIHNWKLKKINGVSFDSRCVKPGDAFVAIKGERYNGHCYIQEALRRGAAAVVAEEPPQASCPVVWIEVADSRLALAQLTAAFYREPSRELTLIGVTGSSGKTTTSTMLQSIYETAGFHAGLIGTVKNCWKGYLQPSKMTTPDALETQKYLRMMVDSGATHAAMEVSSHSLALKRVDGIRYSGAIFTNISPNHLDFHKNMVNYVQAKKRLVLLVKEGGFILANGCDPFFQHLRTSRKRTSLYFYGDHPFCDLFISTWNIQKEGCFFELVIQNSWLRKQFNLDKSFRFFIPVVGKHNIFNASATASAALLTGISKNHISKALASFRGVERRMQVYNLDGFRVIDDKAMNPGGIDAVFRTLQELNFSSLIIVYALRGNRGIQVNRDNGRALADWIRCFKVKRLITTSSRNQVDRQDKVLPEEENAFLNEVRRSGQTPLHFGELPDAVACALQEVGPGATLLLLGSKGMDPGISILKEQLEFQKTLTALSS